MREFYNFEQLADAIVNVEHGGKKYKAGKWPEGKAGEIGPFQILLPYYRDATEYASRKRINLTSNSPILEETDYMETTIYFWQSKILVYFYFLRYGKKEMERMSLKDCVKLGRIHNGGPSGYKKEATKKYGKKIKKYLLAIKD